MSETVSERLGSPGLSEDGPLHIGVFVRAIFELMPDITCTDNDHVACMAYKGASWPDPSPGMDLDDEEPPWLDGGESEDLP